VYLKSLTLRGFKSFASSTTLEFEPGITCVVGPNGSGKSNVVDALAWVMGEQGAKSLRGGKMEDVIFAGTAGRAPLGRAEVVLTIDNSDGALPVEHAEVTIARTMFRSGGSDYAVNGRPCRLLDVQELLSDSGIGREMHVVVGQGQLDAVLQATPEDRRGFVEEAAGVLKHRKRKEKAVRKLQATEQNLQRVQDLLGELRRQLKPLGRQAEVARRAQTVQADLRDARARVLAEDVVSARQTWQHELREESLARERRVALAHRLDAARETESAVGAALADDAPRLAAAQQTWFELSSLHDRISGTARLAAERLRRATQDQDAPQSAADDPDQLLAEAEQVRVAEQRIAVEVHARQHALDAAVAQRQAAEDAHAEEDRRVSALIRAAADRREGLARLHGRLQALRSRAAAADDEIGRLTAARAAALDRAERAERDFTTLENQVAGLDAGESGLDEAYEAAAAEADDLAARLGKLREEAEVAERDKAALQARKEALELGLTRQDGSGALLAASDRVSGVLGSVAAMLTVRPGFEAAVAAALGGAADAVVVDGMDSAVTAMTLLDSDDLGRCRLLIGGSDGVPSQRAAAPAGTTALLSAVDAPAALQPALASLLAGVVVVDSLGEARALLIDHPELTAVSRQGDLLGALQACGGSTLAPSLLEVQAAVDDARERLAEATRAGERLRFTVVRLEDELAQARSAADSSMAAVAEKLAHLGASARSARAESERIDSAVTEAAAARDRDVVGLAELEQRVASAEMSPADEDDGAELARRGDVARTARTAETDARLALRTAEERARALAGRADQLARAASAERAAREERRRLAERRRREAEIATTVVAAASRTLARLELSVQAATGERTEIEDLRAGREAQLVAARAAVRTVEDELASLTSATHRDEVARAEQRLRLEVLEQRAVETVGLDVDTLVEEYGPDVAVPATDDSPPRPYDRDEQLSRLHAAERSLALLGRINPLALEEFAALEERHRFLTEQLDDVRRTRADLLDIVSEVDARVQQVFTEAFADVQREFVLVFDRLFPGGEGSLVLTDPSDLLATGIEVEARPAGKKVKRLSLLSGGERSLVAVAFLVALFKARPSPFYILDEVEAALDDTNLGRLLEIYEELRADSQLLVITHQKRTMEIGDALYGVSMRGDGESVVVSQRLREAASA
jgi:chromosome segregation protein